MSPPGPKITHSSRLSGSLGQDSHSISRYSTAKTLLPSKKNLLSTNREKKMSSTSKKRPKSTTHRNPTSISSSWFPQFLKEPSPSLFPSKEELSNLIVVIAIAVFVALACNYTVYLLNRQPKPFCDSHDLAASDGSLPLPDTCEPCPKFGECFEGNLKCLPGYKRQGRSCVQDGEINLTAKKLSELVELRVCEAYVQFLCYNIGTVWVQEAEMWKELDEHSLTKTFGLKNESYSFSKRRAMETIENTLETRTDVHGFRELKCPDWLVENYKPLTCHVRLWVSKHAMYIVPVSVMFAGLTVLFMSLIRRVRRSQYLYSRAEQLYQQVCEILEENATVGNGANGESEPWVVASRLRDHLLLPRERKDTLLWKKVEELVQEDSRLDQYPKLVKGESRVVWEWQVEGSLSSSRKRMEKPASRLGNAEGTQECPIPQKLTPKIGNFMSY